MKKTVHKWIWAWDFEKEENWLAEMSAQGWHLCGVGFCRYEFEQGEPGAYTVRLEMLDELPSAVQSHEYISFVESTGAEYIGHVLKWVYFRKRADAGGFDLYSDIDSRIRHLNRILLAFLPLAILNGCSALNMLVRFLNSRFPPFAAVFVLSLSVTLLLAYGIYRIQRKRNALETERRLHE